ncbi:MAG: DUF4157 domain-containing protein [Paracoccaceae bacterium]|nr:DUF4157 domain-containing protein [Paracoccaceae bacterium]
MTLSHRGEALQKAHSAAKDRGAGPARLNRNSGARGRSGLEHLRRRVDNSARQRTSQQQADSLQSGVDHSVFPLQAKLTVGAAHDPLEQEADRVAHQIMRMASPGPKVQCACAACEEEARRKPDRPSAVPVSLRRAPRSTGAFSVSDDVEQRIRNLDGKGQPLPASTRDFFEPRFGHDFSSVRVHHSGDADRAARDVGARAFAFGSNIVFRNSEYTPDSAPGKLLLAHELTHVIQQGHAPQLGLQAKDSTFLQSSGLALLRDLADLPGAKLEIPGDCSWAKYAALKLSVDTAKAVTSMMGACKQGDSCVFLALKIAAISAEIAARIAREEACFRGGNLTHGWDPDKGQLRQKANMLKNCYIEFSKSGCSPTLITPMIKVVEDARRVIAAAAVASAIVVVVALIAAIIAALEIIVVAAAALLTSAAASAAVAGTAAALLLLMTDVQTLLTSGDEQTGT